MKMETFVFSIFKDSSLCCSQFVNLVSSNLHSFSNSFCVKFSTLKYNVVSSAYIRKLTLSLTVIKSFIYMLNDSGPSMEPCGIHVVVLVKLDLVSPKITYSFRPVR